LPITRSPVAHVERQRLGNPQAAAVEQREQRGIARGERGRASHVAAMGRDVGRFGLRQGARHRRPRARGPQPGQRRRRRARLPPEEAQQPAHGGEFPRPCRVRHALGSPIRQERPQVGGPQREQRRGIRLRAQVPREEAEEPGQVRAIRLQRVARRTALRGQPVEIGLRRAEARRRAPRRHRRIAAARARARKSSA
jgi:hypothetical protein